MGHASKGIFPERLVGELALSEPEFRQIIQDLKRLPDLRTPPAICPRVVMVAMVFTARYDYNGAFWPLFTANLGEESLNHTKWGEYFRGCLRVTGMFQPPSHWMVNVFPVLFHAIISEHSREPFAVMVRSLIESLDLRDINDDELKEILRSFDLPVSLKAFLTGAESSGVACHLIRDVANNYRQSAGDAIADASDTVAGSLLASVKAAGAVSIQRFYLRAHLFNWRWDFGSGEIGVSLSTNREFTEAPVRLVVGGAAYELDSHLHADGTWRLNSRVTLLKTTEAGAARIELASGDSEGAPNWSPR